MQHPGLVLIDFDGTLVDKDAVVIAAVGKILNENSAPEGFDHEAAFRKHHSKAFPDLMRAVFNEAARTPPAGIDFARALGEAAKGHYNRARECPGAGEFLRYLSREEIPYAIVSNGVEQDMRQCIEHFGWNDLIPPERIYVPARGYASKPDPAMLHAAMGEFLRNSFAPAAQTMMIGDSRADLDAALAAGIGEIHLVTWVNDVKDAPFIATKHGDMTGVLEAVRYMRAPRGPYAGHDPA